MTTCTKSGWNLPLVLGIAAVGLHVTGQDARAQCGAFCCSPTGVCTDVTGCPDPPDACAQLCCNECTTGCHSGTCDPLQACCLPDDTCQVLNPQCCLDIGGRVKPSATCQFVVCKIVRPGTIYEDPQADSSETDDAPLLEDREEDSAEQAESTAESSDEPARSGLGLVWTALLITALLPMLVGLRRIMVRPKHR
ncbi:MAG: hypothetical protein IH987_01680 [Planctomycetes bacterium]|nr:hypothetical protein [Planctomycetota bacterium]